MATDVVPVVVVGFVVVVMDFVVLDVGLGVVEDSFVVDEAMDVF